MSETKSKFKFSCTKCGKCCEDRGPVPLSLHDIELWASKQIIKNMFPYIKIRKSDAGLGLVLNMLGEKAPPKASEKKPSEDGDEDDLGADIVPKGKCPMYNKEGKTCLIHANRPAYCRAFPLGYEDGSYVIEMDTCPGLETKDEINKDLLKQMRDDAKRVFDDGHQLGLVLPVLQALIINAMQEASMRAMSRMSPEDLQKMEDLMKKMSEEKGKQDQPSK
ncbi:MAG: YkgJ family cysteine cluster protein [Candidatus Lokiarchaeota archaeon]|nr:YkgJ family cysteine cluster protein [Candidatus Lokiarchaeota archaeon]